MYPSCNSRVCWGPRETPPPKKNKQNKDCFLFQTSSKLLLGMATAHGATRMTSWGPFRETGYHCNLSICYLIAHFQILRHYWGIMFVSPWGTPYCMAWRPKQLFALSVDKLRLWSALSPPWFLTAFNVSIVYVKHLMQQFCVKSDIQIKFDLICSLVLTSKLWKLVLSEVLIISY